MHSRSREQVRRHGIAGVRKMWAVAGRAGSSTNAHIHALITDFELQ